MENDVVKELNMEEIMEVSGGIWPIIGRIIATSVVSSLVHAFSKKNSNQEITALGIGIAAGTGALGGGVGGILGAAAGGGLVGNAVWMPAAQAITTGGQLISQEY